MRRPFFVSQSIQLLIPISRLNRNTTIILYSIRLTFINVTEQFNMLLLCHD